MTLSGRRLRLLYAGTIEYLCLTMAAWTERGRRYRVSREEVQRSLSWAMMTALSPTSCSAKFSSPTEPRHLRGTGGADSILTRYTLTILPTSLLPSPTNTALFSPLHLTSILLMLIFGATNKTRQSGSRDQFTKGSSTIRTTGASPDLSAIGMTLIGWAWFGPITMAEHFLRVSGSGTSRTDRQAKYPTDSKYAKGSPHCSGTRPTGRLQCRKPCDQIGLTTMSRRQRLKPHRGKIA